MTERTHAKYDRLLEFCKTLPPTQTAVAHPCDESSLRGAVDAARLKLIAPILVGPKARIESVAKQFDIDITGLPIVDAPYSEASAAKAVELVRAVLNDERVQRAKPSAEQLEMIESIGVTLDVRPRRPAPRKAARKAGAVSPRKTRNARRAKP